MSVAKTKVRLSRMMIDTAQQSAAKMTKPVGGWIKAFQETVGFSAVTLAEGILFVSYPTLRSQRAEATRLRQILDWARADFDGVIIFDEAHAMGGVAGGHRRVPRLVP